MPIVWTVLETWRMLAPPGGVIDWKGVEFFIDLFDVDDPELFADLLVAVREHKRELAGA